MRRVPVAQEIWMAETRLTPRRIAWGAWAAGLTQTVAEWRRLIAPTNERRPPLGSNSKGTLVVVLEGRRNYKT
jgi:hypothetical protein